MMLEIAGVQMDIAWEDPAPNYRAARDFAAQAAAEGARLVVLPEMFATGFSMHSEAIAIHASETRERMSDIAADHKIWLLGGYAEPGGPSPAEDRPLARNACSLFSPDGREALRYHKMHPFSFAGEHLHYSAGDRVRSHAVEGLRVTPLICYDLRFPEAFRARAAETDLFVVIANWPASRREHWLALLRARAIENQAYVLGVNRVGEGDGLHYSGDSVLIAPMGEALHADGKGPGLLRGTVDPEAVKRIRERFSFLADRRPLSDFE